MQFRLNHRELSTILASLRFYSEQGQCEPKNQSPWIFDIASDLGTVRPLDGAEVYWLCAKLNKTKEESS